MRFITLAVLLFLWPALAPAQPAPPPSVPAEAYALAVADAARVSPADLVHMRWLALNHLPRKVRPDYVRLGVYGLNQLSRARAFTSPTVVTLVPQQQASPAFLAPVGGGPLAAAAHAVAAQDCPLWDAVLLRLDMRRYRDRKGKGFPHAVWERLAKDDPYFHAFAAVPWPGGIWPGDGVYYPAKAFRTKKLGIAPQTFRSAQEKAANLLLNTLTQSEGPVLRLDHFLDRTAQQEGHDGFSYYDFLQLGNKQADFDQLVGTNYRVPDERGEFGFAVPKKGIVAINNRLGRAQDAFGGSKWRTLDFINNVANRNCLRNLDFVKQGGRVIGKIQEDASEQIGILANGLPGFWLQNGQGVRQDFVPETIASNRFSSTNNARVDVPGTCLWCHKRVLHPFKDHVRTVILVKDSLVSPSEEEAARLADLYKTDINRRFVQDVLQYDAATRECCGLSAEQLSRVYQRLYDRYLDEDVTLERASEETGVPVAGIVASLDAQFAAEKVIDPVLDALRKRESGGVRREHFEEVYGVLWLALRKYPR